VQRNDGHESARRAAMGGARRQKPTISVLTGGLKGGLQGATVVSGGLEVGSAELSAREPSGAANSSERHKT